MRSAWRGDLPFVAPDGAVAIVDRSGRRVHRPVDAARRRGTSPTARRDFWYPFVWLGFRPRAAALDQPADFSRDSDTDSGRARRRSPRQSPRRRRVASRHGEARIHGVVRRAARRGEGARTSGEDRRGRNHRARRHRRDGRHSGLPRRAGTLPDARRGRTRRAARLVRTTTSTRGPHDGAASSRRPFDWESAGRELGEKLERVPRARRRRASIR